MTTIAEVFEQFEVTGDQTALIAALLEREDAACDAIRLAAMQFGLFPQIVAEVLAQAGLGSPPTDEERGMIRAQYEALMIEIQRQQREGGG